MSQTLDQLNDDAAKEKWAALQALLAECTESQRTKFKMIFPDGGRERIDDAIRICERTVANNKAKEEVDEGPTSYQAWPP